MLSADGGVLAADSQVKIDAAGTTPTLLAAQRAMTQYQQIGLYASSDATVGNRDIMATICYNFTGHVQSDDADD
jgi:hypothetical protein